MAKQKFEYKKVINLCGVLDKTEDGNYYVSVEDKDSTETYELSNVLEEMLGNVVNISSDIF